MPTHGSPLERKDRWGWLVLAIVLAGLGGVLLYPELANLTPTADEPRASVAIPRSPQPALPEPEAEIRPQPERLKPAKPRRGDEDFEPKTLPETKRARVAPRTEPDDEPPEMASESTGPKEPSRLRRVLGKVFRFPPFRRRSSPGTEEERVEVRQTATRAPRSVEQGLVLPARPVKQFAPVVPESIASRIDSEIPISVRVEVSPTGKVTSVRSLGHSDGLNAYLASRAVDAVRRWRFQPAKINDRYVPAQMTVNFRFNSSGVEWDR